MTRIYPDPLDMEEDSQMYDRADHELRSRTSWVDAELAYKQIVKGKALGNSCALYIRARLQNRLFYLGGVIQRHPLKTLFLGLLALALCCVGLKAARMETDIQHLWVEEGGRLSQEIEYTRSLLGEDSAAFNELLLVQTPRRGGSSVDVESLLLHQKALQAATEITVDMFDINWKLKDICYTVGFPSYEDRMFDRLLEQLMPCLIITPLDCFWEGSKALGPEYALAVPSYHGYIKWTNLNPYDLVLSIAENLNTFDFVTDAVLGIMHRGGVTSGYQEKPCLNPHDPECPVTAPNWQNKQDPDVGAELTGGCNGFAPKYMHWEEDLIMGGITRNDTGHIVRAEALQSIIQLMGAHEFYKLYKDDNKVHSVDWTLAKAQEVLQTWQRKYTEVVSEMVNTTHRDALHPFSSTSLVDMLTEFSQISFFRVGIGYALMLVYVCISLLKRTDAIRSQAGVGVAGVLLVALSVAAGLGLCSAIGISFNASTTQIIPFLALGLGVNDMFMMVHTYAEVAENLKIPLEDQIGACLKRVGISVVLTSVSNACAFFMAAIIPIPALRAFTLQTGVLVLFNLFTIMTVFPAVLTIDLLRRDKKRVDVFCCFTGYSSPPLAENIELGSRSSSTTIHRSRDPSPPPPYHSQDLLTSQPQRHHRMETRIRRDGSSVTKLTRDPKSYAGSHSSISTFSTQTTEASTEDKKCCVCKCWSLSQLAKHLYAPQLMKTSHKFFVLFIFMVLLGLGVLGTLRVEDGLDLTDVVPRDTREHQYLDAQAKYFGFYNMYAVTKDFDYPNNQQMLYDFHDSFKDVDAIIKREDGSLPPFWLHMFRDWLLDIQEALRLDIADGCIHRGGWYNNATGDGVLGYKLIIQTGDSDPRQRENRDRVLSGALVDDEGIIYPPAFYTLLSAWTSNDALAYAASEANFVPAPREWFYVGDNNDFMIPRSQSLTYAQMPFHLHRMVSTGYITSTIRHIRRICEEYVSDGLPNFPCGIPFTYWEQYLNLRFYLYLSLGCVLLGVFLVLAASLMNVWIAGVVVLVLAVMVVELFGLMGILGIKLSAIPAVILIVSVGIGVEFTVHVCMGFLTSLGSRNHRAIVSLEHTFAPVLHGAISTLLGIVMLAGAEFDFVFKYFFIELFALIVLGLINGLVILPVLLSLIGPRGEVISREHPYLMSLPTPPPSPKAARAKTQKKAKKSSSSKTSSSSKKVYLHTRPHRDSLTTISEEPTQYSSSDVIVCQPEVYVETVPTVRTNYYPSNDTDGSDYASPNSQVTTVKTTATVKVKVRTPLQDGKHSGKPKRRRPIPSPPSTAANLSDSDCSSDQPRPEKPRPRQLRPKKPRPDRPLYDLLDRSEFSDTQFDHLEREYAPQPPQRTSSRSIEGRQYKRVPRYPGATQQLQQLTTDSDTDRSSETDIKYTTHGAKSNKSNPTYSPYKQSGPSQGHPVDPAVTLNTSRSRAAESCGMREVPAVFSSAISPAPTSSDTPTAIDTPPAPPTRCKQIVVKPYRGCSDTDSDLSISSTDDVTTDDEDRRVLEACEFSDTEASLA